MKINTLKKKEKEPKKQKDKLSKEVKKRYLKNGSYSIGISVIFIVIVVVVNLIVGSLPSKYTQLDVSSNQIYSIGDETKEMLQDMEEDVTLYLICESGYEDDNINTLLQRYADETDHVTVTQIDPVVNPKFTADYTDDDLSNNSIIVVSGERSKVVNYSSMYETSINYSTYSYETTGFDGEGQITSAISYVVSENLPVLYVLEGHGEVDLDSSIQDSIEKANIDIQTLNLLTESEVPEDADCLMIISPTSDISEDELDAILEYLEDGGNAMIFSDYTGEEMPNFDSLLENYGVQRADGIVFEGDSQHYAMQMQYYLVPTVNSTDASTDSAASGYYVLMPYAQGIQTLEDVRSTVSISSILSTSDSAYSKTNLSSGTLEKEDEDIEGPFDLGVAITETIDEEEGTETKIIYYSTAYILDSSVDQMVSGGNSSLVMESLGWMTDTDENTSVSIASKSLEVSYLTLTDYDASFWKIMTIGVIPGVFLVVGFLIWMKRRTA